MTHPRPTPLDAVRLAAAAGCDPRTAAAYLAGRPVRGSYLAARLAAAAAALGSPRAPAPAADRAA